MNKFVIKCGNLTKEEINYLRKLDKSNTYRFNEYNYYHFQNNALTHITKLMDKNYILITVQELMSYNKNPIYECW